MHSSVASSSFLNQRSVVRHRIPARANQFGFPNCLVELPPPCSPFSAALGWPLRVFWVSRSHSLGFPPRSYRSRCRLVDSHSCRLGYPLRHVLRVASARDRHRSRRTPVTSCWSRESVRRIPSCLDFHRSEYLLRPAGRSWRERVLTLFHPRAQGVWQKFFRKCRGIFSVHRMCTTFPPWQAVRPQVVPSFVHRTLTPIWDQTTRDRTGRHRRNTAVGKSIVGIGLCRLYESDRHFHMRDIGLGFGTCDDRRACHLGKSRDTLGRTGSDSGWVVQADLSANFVHGLHDGNRLCQRQYRRFGESKTQTPCNLGRLMP